MVSVVVVTHQSAATIDACLAALTHEARRLPLEVIVVDAGSTDDTVAIIAANHPARLIEMRTNRGFGAGVNRGAEVARGEFLAVLNPDTVLHPRTLVELVDAIRREPSVGIIGPRIIRPDGRAELSHGDHVDFIAELRQKTITSLARLRVPGGEAWLDSMTSVEGDPDWISGAAFVMPTDLYRHLGGMDESFFLYFEDVDLCRRVRMAGRGVRFDPTAVVVHLGGASVAADPTRVAIEYRRSQLHFYHKHHGRKATENLKSYLRGKYRLAWILALAARRHDERRLAREILAVVEAF